MLFCDTVRKYDVVVWVTVRVSVRIRDWVLVLVSVRCNAGNHHDCRHRKVYSARLKCIGLRNTVFPGPFGTH